MNPVVYCTPLLFPVIATLGMILGGLWSWVLPVVVFGLVPLVELKITGAAEDQSSIPGSNSQAHRWVLYLTLPLTIATALVLQYKVSVDALSWLELAGGVLSTGIVLGGLGINVGHELGHSRSPFERNLAKALLCVTLYMHFFIEHNRGHHKNVATDEDPASSRRGESVYPFWFRSVLGGWMSAWRIDAKQMTRFQLIQLAVSICVFGFFGWQAGLAWVVASMLGILLLETVNYVEHYGLRRLKRANGRYERVRPVHSWNADHPLGRALLFELTRHADHHANAGRSYATLRHLGQAPQLPTGYPGMIMAALFPPLFFALMHPRLDAQIARAAS